MQYAQMFSVSTEWVLGNAAAVLTAFVVLCIGWYAARVLSHRAGQLLHHTKRIDNTIRPLITELVRYTVLTVTVIIVLGQFGVQTASILAVLGAVGLAIALALQGTLSNIAAGVMLIWLRPFNAGEYIDGGGIAGTVVEIGLFGTRLRTFDGIYIFTPNANLWNAKIINYSREKTRMLELQVRIGYDANLAKAREVLLKIAKDKRVLAEPAPFFYVGDLGESAITIALRVWLNSGDWWACKTGMTERIKLDLDAAGVEIPHNKLDVHIKQADGSAAAPQVKR